MMPELKQKIVSNLTKAKYENSYPAMVKNNSGMFAVGAAVSVAMLGIFAYKAYKK